MSLEFLFQISVVHSGISLTKQKTLTSAMTNFVQYSGFGFCLSRSLEVFLSG